MLELGLLQIISVSTQIFPQELMFPFKTASHDKDAPHDQSLAKQFLPIGCYGQEPILDRANACKLEGLQNDAAKSR